MDIKKNETVEAGVLDKLFKSLGNILGKAFSDTLKDLDKEIKDVRTNSNGDMLFTTFPGDDKLQPYKIKYDNMQIDPDGTVTYEVSVQDPSGKVYPNIVDHRFRIPVDDEAENGKGLDQTESDDKGSQYEKEITPEIVTKAIKEDKIENLNQEEVLDILHKFEDRVMTQFPIRNQANSSINIKLKKIVGSDETTIDLIGLSTNQPSTVALTNLNSVLDDDEFVACLPENEECNYSICDNGNDLIVDEYTDELTPATDIDILNILLSNLVVEQRNIEFILNNLQNKYDVLQTSSSLDGICWQIDDDIKDISDYIKVCGGTVPNLGTLVSNDPYIENVSSDPVMIKQTILECLNSIVNSYKLYGICISTPEINSAIQDKLLRLESMMLTI